VFKYRSGSNGWNWFGFDDPITPVSRLLPGPDGKLYGLTRSGGKQGAGVLFQFDPSDNFVASKQETAKAEEIASKAILPPELRQRAVDSAEDTEERRSYDAALDTAQTLAQKIMPGIDPRATELFRPLFHAEADADHANRVASERVVNASGGAKKLCPKCKGYKRMVVHGYKKDINPYPRGTLLHAAAEGNWSSTTSFAACDECCAALYDATHPDNKSSGADNSSSGPSRTRRTCPACGGTGYVTVRDYAKPTFQGQTWVDRQQVCWRCGGQGYVDD
jgi:hypothetical protein